MEEKEEDGPEIYEYTEGDTYEVSHHCLNLTVRTSTSMRNIVEKPFLTIYLSELFPCVHLYP